MLGTSLAVLLSSEVIASSVYFALLPNIIKQCSLVFEHRKILLRPCEASGRWPARDHGQTATMRQEGHLRTEMRKEGILRKGGGAEGGGMGMGGGMRRKAGAGRGAAGW